MLKKKLQGNIYEEIENKYKEDIEFDWTDILAFIIATFQVVLPYAFLLIGVLLGIMILFSILF